MVKDIESKFESDTSATSSHSSNENQFEEPCLGPIVQPRDVFSHSSDSYDEQSIPQQIVGQNDHDLWEEIDKHLQRHVSSSSESDDDIEKSRHLRNELAEWAVSGNIPLTSVTKLLGILRKYKMDVPAQATTLLKTPRDIVLSRKSGTLLL